MEILSEFVRNVAEFINNNRHLVMLATSVVAAIFAAIILLLRSQALPAERWAKYFGGAFAVFSIQYATLFATPYLKGSDLSGEFSGTSAGRASLVFGVVCSISNNLLFLAAARELLDKKPAFPKWVWVPAAVSLLAILDADAWKLNADVLWWSRLPDALFSAYCLGAVGYATAINLSFRPRPFLALGALGIGIVYALLQIMHGLNPLLAYIDFTAIQGYKNKLLFLDDLDRAILLPLKFGLFFSALILLIKALVVVSSNDIEKMSEQIISGRSEYLTSDGIVKSIGDSLQADTVELLVKVPGVERKRVASFVWRKGHTSEPVPSLDEFPSSVQTIAAWILLEGEEAFENSGSEEKYRVYREQDRSTKYAAGIRDGSLVVGVPVRFHGAIIGCLKIEWKATDLPAIVRHIRYPSASLRATAVPHIKNLADLIAPSVQAYREIFALNMFGSRFARLQVRQPVSSIEQSVEMVTGVLNDVLSPLATGLRVEMGFQQFRKVKGENVRVNRVLEQEFANSAAECISEAEARHLDESGVGSVDFLRSELFARTRIEEDDKDYPIGELILAVPSGRDEIGHPTLATNYQHRRTVALLASDAVLDSAREYLNSILKDLGVRLNSQSTINISGWFQGVQEAAKEAGLLWVVAEQPRRGPLLGSPKAVNFIESMPKPIEEGEFAQCRSIPINPRAEGARNVIEIHLPTTAVRVWFGVGRPGFGEELVFPSPWRIFIEHFAEIADSALVRLTAAMEIENVRTEAAQYQGLATVAVTTGTLIHQIINMTQDLTGPASELLDAYTIGDLKCDHDDGKLIRAMSESTERLLELTSNITNVTKLDERRPCSLLDAALQSKKLFEFSLAQREIRLEINIARDIVVDVPFHVAALTLANLISNAKDAIKKEGAILIEAEKEETKDMVYCYVTDDGPGIPAEIKDRIFDLGVTTNPNSGGWGLYLVARSLRENRGNIELCESGPGETRFIIRFPKERQEELL